MLKRAVVVLLVVSFGYALWLSGLDESKLPPLEDADLVFQTTRTNQSLAIGIASASVYIHAGIIKKTPQGFSVIQAADHVRETPLTKWIQGGILQRFSVYRYKGLTTEQKANIIKAASAYYGEPYNFYFTFDKGSMYCSELLYLSYKDAGIPLGTVEKIGALHINNRFTKEIIEERWQNYPSCNSPNVKFEQCYERIMDGDIITPASVAHDPHLVRIFDNYPW